MFDRTTIDRQSGEPPLTGQADQAVPSTAWSPESAATRFFAALGGRRIVTNPSDCELFS
jgi:hypothetical protein